MITIEDANNEKFYINPVNVVYVKQREKFWKILLTTGEAIMTKNGDGAMAIVHLQLKDIEVNRKQNFILLRRLSLVIFCILNGWVQFYILFIKS